MLEPSEPGRGWTVLPVGLLAAGAMLGAGRLEGRRRQLAAALALIPLFALTLLAGRVPDELLLPGGWSELAGGISRGISDLPGVRVPYRGLDTWVRTDIPLGGAALVADRRRARVLAAAQPARVPAARAAGADRALRRAGRRAQLHRRVRPRRGLHAADGRVPAAGEAAPRPTRSRPPRWRSSPRSSRSPPRRSSTATRPGSTTRRGRPRRPRRARRRSPGSTTTTGSTGRATAASCCASAPASPPTGRPRTSTSSTAHWLRSRRSTTPCPSAPRTTRGSSSAGRSRSAGLDPQPAHRPVHHRRLRARPRHPAADHRPDARRARASRRARCAAATPTSPTSTRRARRRTSAAARAIDYDPSLNNYTSR